MLSISLFILLIIFLFSSEVLLTTCTNKKPPKKSKKKGHHQTKKKSVNKNLQKEETNLDIDEDMDLYTQEFIGNLPDNPATPAKKRTPVKLLSSNQVLPPVHRTAYAKTNDPNYQTLAGIGDVFNDPAIGAPSVPQASKPTIYGARTGKLPDKQLTNQYLVTNPTDLQSLTPINGNVFGRDKKPADQRVFVEPNDPNYHTLARIRQDIFGPDKKANVSIARGQIVPFDQNAKAATKDPNYQTLAGINADIFGEDKKNKNDWPKAPVPPIDCGKKVDARDPNYQSLAGIGNDIFGPDKKQYDAAVPKVPHAPIDQNTKTLAAINNDIFGADKKK